MHVFIKGALPLFSSADKDGRLNNDGFDRDIRVEWAAAPSGRVAYGFDSRHAADHLSKSGVAKQLSGLFQFCARDILKNSAVVFEFFDRIARRNGNGVKEGVVDDIDEKLRTRGVGVACSGHG